MSSNDRTPGMQDAFSRYRRAAMGAGVDWFTPAVGTDWQPPDQEQVAAVFDATALPADVVWLYTRCAPEARMFPEGAWLLPWPVDSASRCFALNLLGRSFGTPFPWRQQFPLMVTDHYVFTVVLHPGPHHGEVWRYEFDGDVPDPVRAARDLPALFDEWVRGITAGLLRYRDLPGELALDDALFVAGAYEGLPQRFADRDPSCDLRAYPESIPEQQLRAWQRECGVDVDYLAQYGDTETFVEFMEEVMAVAASL